MWLKRIRRQRRNVTARPTTIVEVTIDDIMADLTYPNYNRR
jgi:hypothetical protein